MSQLDLKRLKVELLRVSAAKAEQELRIEEFQDNIKRVEASIEIQKAKEVELAAKISEMEQSLK